MSQTVPQSPVPPSAAPTGRPESSHGAGPQVQRQFVSFSCFKLDPAFRRLSSSERQAAREEFTGVLKDKHDDLICLTYSTVGMRPEIDFVLWRISLTPDVFQHQQAAINKTTLAGYLTQPYSFLSMTKRSMYIDLSLIHI